MTVPEPPFEGHPTRECGEHRTAGPHRAWCYDCGAWCHPRLDAACHGCELPHLRAELARLREELDEIGRLRTEMASEDDDTTTWAKRAAVWAREANVQRERAEAAETTLAAARELLDYAWRLRAYGERAPGGTETWAEWVARAEPFLRSLPAPSATHVPLHLGRGFETVREHVADCPVCRLRAALDTGGDPQP